MHLSCQSGNVTNTLKHGKYIAEEDGKKFACGKKVIPM